MEVLSRSPSSGTDGRPSYSQGQTPAESYMGLTANVGGQRPAYDAHVSEGHAGHPLDRMGNQYASEGLRAPYPASSSHLAEEIVPLPAGSSQNRYEVAPSDPSNSRKQVRPAFSTTPLPRLVHRDSSAYAETRSQDSQKSIHALSTALQRPRSDFAQAPGAPRATLEPVLPLTPLRASPVQPETSPVSIPIDKGKGREAEEDVALRSLTHTFHAQYRYTYPSVSPHDSPPQGRRSPFADQSPPSGSPNDRLRSSYLGEGGKGPSRYHDYRDSRSRFSPDASSTTTSSSSSSGFSPPSAISTAYSLARSSQQSDARSLPSLSSLSLQRSEKMGYRNPMAERGNGEPDPYANASISLPPIGIRGQREQKWLSAKIDSRNFQMIRLPSFCPRLGIFL